MLLSILLFSGCIDKEAEVTERNQFQQDYSVLITSPQNGAIIEDSFFLKYNIGADVHDVQLWIDGLEMMTLEVSSTEKLLSLEEGPHTIELVGLDNQGEWLSDHSITLTVPTEHWVTITSPADNAFVSNPVQFTVNASDSVDVIEIFADDWSLGTTVPSQVLSYTFSGTGFAREIEAIAYHNGVEIASHNIEITVDAGTDPIISDFNTYVNEIIPTYPTDGSYGYYWPTSGNWLGTTSDIIYQGTVIAEGDPNHQSYCVGLTFEVFMRAWQQVDVDYVGDGTINGMSVYDLNDFRIEWYVRDLFGAGPADAAEIYGIGEIITDWNDVQPGDFIQFWRNSNSGHNAIFVDWEWDSDGNIVGFLYWSTQNSTDGIGYNSEYFGSTGSSVNAQYFFPARIYTPDYWLPW